MADQKFQPACRSMEWLDPFYRQVWEKAYAEAIPISGTFELTPRCNFNCRMCYVHLPVSDIDKHGRELTASEWIRIAAEAKAAGTVWLCITGGEPLMHPEFETIWRELTQMGFFITLQTNAAQLTDYESLLAEYPPRRCKITLYGASDEVYEKVCRTDRGFTRVDAGIQMLRQLKIPVELVSTVIRQNLDDVDHIIQYADSNHFRWTPNINVRTAGRGVDVDMDNLRIHPLGADGGGPHRRETKEKAVMDPDRKPCTYCRDYRVGYWVVWSGYMRFCSFMNGPDISVRDGSFRECWRKLVEFQENMQWPEECRECVLKEACARCAALYDIEDGALKIRKEFCRKGGRR